MVTPTKKIQEQAIAHTGVRFGIEHLGLSSDELIAVKQQGHVAHEVRGRSRIVFKLRYRFDGRQRVRHLGSDPQFAQAVREELQHIRRVKVARRNLRTVMREAKQAIRNSKLQLLPFAAEFGFAFHGFELRRRRHPDS